MRVRLVKTVSFEAAHRLPSFPEGHQCSRMHGHSYKVDVVVEGDIPEGQTYLIDYTVIKDAVEPIRSRLDHACLNDIEGLENPTAEFLARWIYDRLKSALPILAEIHVWESETSRCEYRGEA
ncbi:MAG: 6-carboxytetrahydropterin synthase QueD [Phycisphaerales bacterium]|nr:MAG: 6-carboxytetrahydropterin synthase QueD [Phycisphaerales bacterium]